MRIKTISRSDEECTRERVSDLAKVHRNLDPALHPLQRATEYTRAVAAVKLGKTFAKPFLCALGGHADGLTCLARNPRAGGCLLSGAADGEVLLWDLPARRAVATLRGHTRAVRGIACAPDGRHAVSVGDDAAIRLWQLPGAAAAPAAAESAAPAKPVASFHGRHALRDVDHHWRKAWFATAGAAVQLWDHERSEPLAEYNWGVDTVASVRFNPAEADLFASCGSDRRYAPACPLARLPSHAAPSTPPQRGPVRCARGHAPAEAHHAQAGQPAGVESSGGVQLHRRVRGQQPLLLRHAQTRHCDQRAQGLCVGALALLPGSSLYTNTVRRPSWTSTTRRRGGSSSPARTTGRCVSSPTTVAIAERCTTQSGCSGASWHRIDSP